MAEVYRLDDLLVDLPRHRVERQGVVLDVHGLSFRLLQYLVEQGQRVVGFDELIAQVWAPAVVNEETVTQRVRLLRQALGDDGRRPRYVRSVRGRGYQLCMPPQPWQAPAHLGAAAGTSRRLLRVATVMVVALAVPGLAATAWWQLRRAPAPVSPLQQRAAYYAGIGQRDDNERAITLYRERLQEAPDDPDALLGLSRAYSARVCMYDGDVASAERAQALAGRVLAAHPRDARAHAALAYSFDCRGRVDEALRGYERALALDPDAGGVRGSAAYLYAQRGRLADALAANLAVRQPERVRFLQLQVAANLDLLGYAAEAEARYRRQFRLYPDNVFSNIAWPAFLMRHGRDAEARAALSQALSRGTGHAGLHLLAAELALLQDDRPGARRALERAMALRPRASLPRSLAWLLQERRPDAATLRARAQELRAGLVRGREPLDGIEAALLLDAAGDRDAAFAALADTLRAGYRDAAYLRASPWFAALRRDPRFARVLERIAQAVGAERATVRARGLESRLLAAASP